MVVTFAGSVVVLYTVISSVKSSICTGTWRVAVGVCEEVWLVIGGCLDGQTVWVIVSRHVTMRTDCADDGFIHSLSFDEGVVDEPLVLLLLAV